MRGNFFRLTGIPPITGGGAFGGGMAEIVQRGEAGISPAIGLPPQASESIPSAPGTPNQSVAMSDRQSNWQSIPFVVGTDPVKLQDFLLRKFLLLQNLSGAGTLLFGFGWQPTLFNALVLPVGFGYEPFAYPTNEIWVAATAAGTQGLIIYGT